MHTTTATSASFPFVRAGVESAVAALRDIYAERGYLDAVVDEPVYAFRAGDSLVDITIAIREGPPYRVRRLNVAGDPPPEARDPLARLERDTVGRPYTPRLKLVLRSQAVEIMGGLGYPDAHATVSSATPDGPGPVDLTLTIDPGPLVVVESVRVEGAQRTREGFIRERLKLRPGDRYDLGLEGKHRRPLQVGRLPAARGRPRPHGRPRAPRPRGQGGGGREPGSVRRTRVRILRRAARQGRLPPQAPAGLGAVVELGGDRARSVPGRREHVERPLFLGADLKADLTGFAQRREEPRSRAGISAAAFVTRELSRSLTLSTGYTLRSTDLSDLGSEVESEDSREDYDLSSVKVQATYDTRNDLLYPSAGQRSFAAVEQAEGWLGGDVNFTRLTLGSRLFVPLPGAVVLGLRYDTGLIIPGRGDINVPLAERFFNGGENTVRSFKEDRLGPRDASGKPAGGLGTNVLSVELRRRLVENFTGSLFADLGNVAPNRTPGGGQRGGIPQPQPADLGHPGGLLPRLPTGPRVRAAVPNPGRPGAPGHCLQPGPGRPARRGRLRRFSFAVSAWRFNDRLKDAAKRSVQASLQPAGVDAGPGTIRAAATSCH